jgi:N-acetylglutamate synthase-like GNAT family acetyltransferase
LWPGAGSILAAVTTASGVTPVVVGKPSRPMFEAAARWAGASNPLVVGDRLDTDIAGAAGMGWDSLFVWSGAHARSDLSRADHLPTYAGAGLGTLLLPGPRIRIRPGEPGDVEGIASLLAASGLSAAGVWERLTHTVVGVDDGGTIVATACASPLGSAALIRSVAVRQDLRGGGLGLLIAAAALRVARSSGAPVAVLLTDTAGPFFERLGFAAIERSALPPGVASSPQATAECDATATAMVADLRVGLRTD